MLSAKYKKLKNCFIEVSFVSPDEIRRLNKKYRSKDFPTDVLSFSIDEKLPDGRHYLGDVVINASQAEEQAKKLGKTVEEEIAFLTGHGMLHLLGVHHD